MVLFLNEDQRYSGLTPQVQDMPVLPDAPAPTLGETGDASFTLYNDVTNGLRYLERPTFQPDPTYNPLDDPGIKNTVFETDYLDHFVGSRSQAESQAIIGRIDRERKAMEVRGRSGFNGVLTDMAAGALSPVTFIPVVGWLAKARQASRMGQIALAAGEVGAATAGAVALQQAALYGTREIKPTAEEIAWTIGGSAVIGSILGGIAGTLTRPAVERMVREVGEEINRPVGASSVGAAATDAARGTGELKSTGGAAQALRRLNPSLRTQTSEFQATRNTVRDLIAGDVLEENAAGIPSSAGGAVEVQVDIAHGPMIAVHEDYRKLYSEYFFAKRVPMPQVAAGFQRLIGQGAGRMSYYEFRQAISEAALAGDTHAIPQVAQAAKARRAGFVDPLRDDAMQSIKGFKELVEAGSADQSYLTRLWNRVAVKAGFTELRSILASHFEAQQASFAASGGETRLVSRADAESLADDVIQNILGQSPGRIAMPKEFNIGTRGPLKERMLASLPTAAVLKFVERDIEAIDRAYVKSMATDIALTKKFGSVDMVDQIAKITDEANALKAGKSEAEQARIAKAAENDIRDLTAMRDIIRGTYKLPDNPDGLLHRSVAVGKTLNFLSSLGMMTVSAISDVGKHVMVHGLMRTMRPAFSFFVKQTGAIKLARKDVKLAAAGIDMITNDRLISFAELVDEYHAGSAFERGVQQAGRAFSFLTLMSPWNAVQKQFAGIITQTRALQAIEGLATGKNVSKKEIEFLAAGGIDRNAAERIFAQFDQHGTRDGDVWAANTSAWNDKQAVQGVRALVNREVNRIIVTPGAGDKPLRAHGDLGSVIFQFQSFAVSSIQRTLLSGLAQRDMAVLNGVLVMMALGATSYYLKGLAAGTDPASKGPGVWAAEAVDNSGILGILSNANHAIEKLTDDRFGVSALTGQPARRYLNVNKWGAIFGPSVGKGSDLWDIIGAVSNIGRTNPNGSTRGLTASDIHKMRKMVPLQNLFLVRNMFDRMEAGVTNAFGIPKRAN